MSLFHSSIRSISITPKEIFSKWFLDKSSFFHTESITFASIAGGVFSSVSKICEYVWLL